MKLEKQVVSLELAKKLKEFGVKQESAFYWQRTVGNPDPHCKNLVSALVKFHCQNDAYLEHYSAYTVAELGEILGNVREKDLLMAYGHIFNVRYPHTASVRGVQMCMAEPELGAKMLIYLLENKLTPTPVEEGEKE